MKNDIITETEEKFKKSIEFLKIELSKLSIDKINFSLIEDLKIIYNDALYPIKHISVISKEKHNVINIKPFDKKVIQYIYKAITELKLDLNVYILKDLIAISAPAPSTERRELFVSRSEKKGENVKTSIRNIRRDTAQEIKMKAKKGEISKDIEKKLLNELDVLTAKYIKMVDDLVAKKTKELLNI